MDNININFKEKRLVFLSDTKQLVKRKKRKAVNILATNLEEEPKTRRIINPTFEYNERKIRNIQEIISKNKKLKEKAEQRHRINQIKSAREKLKKFPMHKYIKKK